MKNLLKFWIFPSVKYLDEKYQNDQKQSKAKQSKVDFFKSQKIPKQSKAKQSKPPFQKYLKSAKSKAKQSKVKQSKTTTLMAAPGLGGWNFKEIQSSNRGVMCRNFQEASLKNVDFPQEGHFDHQNQCFWLED